jgi:beta-xylosidase
VFQPASLSGVLQTSTLSGLVPGAQVILETSSDLVIWTPIQTNITDTTTFTFTITNTMNTNAPAQFFRATEQ